MNKIYIILLLTFTLITSQIPAAFGADEITKPTPEEVQNALKDIVSDVKIIEIRPAPVQGLWEIALESKGQKGVIYLDASKKYAVFGSLLDLTTKTNLTQERSSELNKVAVADIPLDDALVMGEKDAKYRVIVFSDPD